MSVSRRLIAIPVLLAALVVSASAGDVTHQHSQAHQADAGAEAEPGRREGGPEARSTRGPRPLFYKAYLIDPNDPFTLNNLGYIAELEGQADRAQRYYDLAQAQGSDAVVYKSTERAAVGTAGRQDRRQRRRHQDAGQSHQRLRDRAAAERPGAGSRPGAAEGAEAGPDESVHAEQSRLRPRERRRAGGRVQVLHRGGEPALGHADRGERCKQSWRGKGISEIAGGQRQQGPQPDGPRAGCPGAGRAAEYARRRGHQSQRLQAGAAVFRAGLQARSRGMHSR